MNSRRNQTQLINDLESIYFLKIYPKAHNICFVVLVTFVTLHHSIILSTLITTKFHNSFLLNRNHLNNSLPSIIVRILFLILYQALVFIFMWFFLHSIMLYAKIIQLFVFVVKHFIENDFQLRTQSN